jgi:soluble lytic murein transglycosylase
MDRYARAHDHYRPWMLAIVLGDDALRGPADGRARVWWQYAYPQAYQELVEKYQSLGDDPPYYLYSIMRKESGFNPHDLSYADAQGLLQMIPPTTARVAKFLGIQYDAGKLYDPEFNVKTGAWYIGHLLSKFGGQIPIGAGSFNCGPRPMMKWLDKNGDRPIDELVELVSYTQTREYMKKVTENYARYVYLYDGTVYEQPLTVDKAYRVDDITY